MTIRAPCPLIIIFMLSMFLLSFDFSVTNTENIDILSCLPNKACPQHSHNAIFDRDCRLYSVKTLQAFID